MRNSSNFAAYSFANLLPWLYWCHLSIRRSLNDVGTYLPFSSSFIISHVSIGRWSRDARMFSKLVQYWLAWPVSFMAVNLIFLGSVRLYHVKYLSSWSVLSKKIVGHEVHQRWEHRSWCSSDINHRDWVGYQCYHDGCFVMMNFLQQWRTLDEIFFLLAL